VIVGEEEYAVTLSRIAVTGKLITANVADDTALANELTNQLASDDVKVEEPML
jgi:hypothetical protein